MDLVIRELSRTGDCFVEKLKNRVLRKDLKAVLEKI
jgi:hypothetical protein